MIYRLTVGEIQTNCWIIPLPKNEKECIVVDPGGEGETILARLEKLNLNPRYIVLTHAHFDHIAALPKLAAAFPSVEIAIHQEEANKLGPESLEFHRQDFAAVGASAYVETLWKPMPSATLLLQEGHELGPFRILHLPGHSPGSIGLYWKEEKILISGDTLFRMGIGRTDLYGGEQEILARSLQRLFTLDEDTVVFPGHGARTTIGREKGVYF
ncbi:MAG: MBL fold metallo-hydrolase [Treponema sp.]|jgi:glyoxylase-like metal-dependent hydrolase (beta-lactamase superfamily II)|nr:MBL fold metallo-hydrolase [Treponema sp.]